MAKIRVYELARELKIESKKLVDDLNAGGLQVKNYMSTLDEAMASKARKIVSGSVSEVVVEKRVKPRVIRRRKKIVQVEPKPVEPKEEGEEPSTDGAPETIPESPVVEEASSPAPTEVEKARTAEKIETAVSDDDAQAPAEVIVKAPEAPDVEAPKEEAKAPDATVVAPPPEVSDETVGEKPEVIEEESPVQAPPVSTKPAEKETPSEKEEAVVKEKKTPSPEKPVKAKGKKGKKRKSEKPAKIISPPEEGPLKNILARETERKAEKPKLDTKELHEIEIKKLSTKIGWSDDYCRENMIDSLRKLKTTAVQWNLTGVDDENDWTESTMLASFKVRKREGVIEYGYSPHLREVLRYPNVYAKLDTVIQKGLSSKYSLNLWEYCRSELFRVEGKECITEPVPIEDFRKILGIHDDRYPKFKIFNHSILKPAIAEVSEKTDVQVTVEKSIKEKRKIVALVFSISEKQAVQLGLPMVRKDKEREAVVQKMLAYNLSRKVIKNYLDENEPYEIAESIEAAEAFMRSTVPP